MIRYATKNDAKEMHMLILQLNSDDFSYDDFCRTLLRNLLSNHCLVEEIDGKIVGLGVLSIIYPLHHCAKIGEVMELVVDENSRGKGTGKRLLDMLTTIAKEQGCKGIELSSNQKRKDAHRFYEREGFVNTHYKLTKKA